MRVPRWFPLVVALPTVVRGGISVWAVGIESRRAERELLTEFQVLAERELELWRGSYEILKPVPIIVPEAAFASQWFPSVESPGAGERAHWGRFYEIWKWLG